MAQSIDLSKIPNLRVDPLAYVLQKRLIDPAGLLLEFGVYKGSTINRIAAAYRESQIFGFDSFEGLPENWGRTDMIFDKGAFTLEGNLPPVRSNVTLVKGWFNETLPRFLEEHPGPISLLHIDCDIYSSTKTVFDLTKTRIQDGCVIVFDELINYPGFEEHELKAWQELLAETGMSWEWVGMNGDVQTHSIRDRGAYDQKVAVKILKNPMYM